MSTTVDARTMACPKPLLMTKKAMDTADDLIVIVDNEVASNNVQRFSTGRGYDAKIEKENDSLYRIHIVKKEGASAHAVKMTSNDGPTVFVFSSNIMGRGDDDLGTLLMKGFIHAATELDQQPDVMVFYNTGAKLAARDADTAADIKSLEECGVTVLVCGACVKHFGLADNLCGGTVSNMYDILETLSQAGRIVTP